MANALSRTAEDSVKCRQRIRIRYVRWAALMMLGYNSVFPDKASPAANVTARIYAQDSPVKFGKYQCQGMPVCWLVIDVSSAGSYKEMLCPVLADVPPFGESLLRCTCNDRCMCVSCLLYVHRELVEGKSIKISCYFHLHMQ